jgi:hypothetical protein
MEGAKARNEALRRRAKDECAANGRRKGGSTASVRYCREEITEECAADGKS